MNENLKNLLLEDKPKGFTMFGGTMRYYMWKANRSMSEWKETINEMIISEEISRTGNYDVSGDVLDICKKEI